MPEDFIFAFFVYMSKLIVAGLVLIAIAYLVITRAGPTRFVRSDFDGKPHPVLNTANCKAAADVLALLEANARRLLVECETFVPGDRRFANIRRRWSGTLREIDGSDNIAYSVGKRDVSICVRRPDGTVEDFNDVMFVLLHELSHIANDSYGHNEEFWDTFQFVLEVAERTGIYRFEDYGRRAVKVCGKEISTTPLSCVKTRQCASALGPIRPSPGFPSA